MVWTKDNKSIFYVTKDDLDRPYKVRDAFAARYCAGFLRFRHWSKQQALCQISNG